MLARGRGASQELSNVIIGVVSKVDLTHAEIARRLSPAQWAQQGLSLTDLAH